MGARQPCVACGWAGACDARGVSEHRQPPQSGQMVRSLAGLAGSRNERSIPARAPSDVSGLYDCGHGLQPPGMEYRHSAAGDGGVGIPVLPHPCRRADALSRCRMVDLRCLGPPPPLPRPLVGRLEIEDIVIGDHGLLHYRSSITDDRPLITFLYSASRHFSCIRPKSNRHWLHFLLSYP